MRYYITPQDYENAEKIGVSNNLLYRRVYVSNWDVDKAVNTPVKVRKCKIKHLKIARKNGIKDVTFYSRLNRGWNLEDASTITIEKATSKQWMDKHYKKMRKEYRKYPNWVYENLEKNGIKLITFWSRVNNHGWSLEEASTVKPLKRGRNLND